MIKAYIPTGIPNIKLTNNPGLYSWFLTEKIIWVKLLNMAKLGIHKPNIMFTDDKTEKIGIKIQTIGILTQNMILSFNGK